MDSSLYHLVLPVSMGIVYYLIKGLTMNYHKHPHGTICVARMSNGREEWLAVPQQWYKEWTGCFSVI